VVKSWCDGKSDGEQGTRREAGTASTGSGPDPVEHFREIQANTPTPYGRVMPETATRTPDGSSGSKTEDGEGWKVSATPNADQGFTCGTPSEIR
jgi:hypothetical protein